MVGAEVLTEKVADFVDSGTSGGDIVDNDEDRTRRRSLGIFKDRRRVH